jgi:hypothetical protein
VPLRRGGALVEAGENAAPDNGAAPAVLPAGVLLQPSLDAALELLAQGEYVAVGALS